MTLPLSALACINLVPADLGLPDYFYLLSFQIFLHLLAFLLIQHTVTINVVFRKYCFNFCIGMATAKNNTNELKSLVLARVQMCMCVCVYYFIVLASLAQSFLPMNQVLRFKFSSPFFKIKFAVLVHIGRCQGFLDISNLLSLY